MIECDNDICNRAARFEVQGLPDKVLACGNHLPWAVRSATGGNDVTVSVKEVNQEGVTGLSKR